MKQTSLVKMWRVRYTWQCDEFVSQPADRADAMAAAASNRDLGAIAEPVWVWT